MEFGGFGKIGAGGLFRVLYSTNGIGIQTILTKHVVPTYSLYWMATMAKTQSSNLYLFGQHLVSNS